MAYSVVWGLDIGNSAVKAVKMVRKGGGAVVTEFDIIDIQAGEDEADKQAKVTAALKTLTSNHNFGRDPVFVSLPGDLCLFREFQLPPGSESKIHELVQFEAKQQIPFPLDQVKLGYEVYEDPAGGKGVEMIVIRKADVEQLLKLTDSINLNIVGVTVSPVALFNFIQFEFQPTGATLVLDAGYKGTDFVVMQGRHIYSRAIPIAGREITRSLENKFKVPYDKAEELKKNIGQSKQADKILGVIEPTLRQLSAEIQRTLGFFKSKARGQKIQQAYLLGHTFRLPKMAETLASVVREAGFNLVEGVQRVSLAQEVNPGVFNNEFPTLPVAVGLALQGLGLSELKVNLLPDERAQAVAKEGTWKWGAAAAAAIVLAAGLVIFHGKKQEKEVAALEEQVTKTLDDSKKEQGNVDKAKQGLEEDKGRLERLVRPARDRGKLVEVYERFLDLKDDAGKRFFGDERRVYLTNVYVSRAPFDVTGKSVLKDANDTRTSDLSKSDSSIFTESGPYHDFKKAEKAFEKAPDARIDLPLVVVLSGEVAVGEGGQYLDALMKLKKALESVEGVEGKVTIDHNDLPDRTESRPVYSETGYSLPGKAEAGSTERMRMTAFHVAFRWNPKEDPDKAE